MRSIGSLPDCTRVLRDLDAQPLDRLRRRDAGLGGEAARKMPCAHVGLLGQALHGQILIEMLARPGEQRLEAAARRFQFEQRRELRLPARAAVIDDELLRGRLRDLVAELVGDHRQREIDAGGDAGRAPDVAVLHIDAIGFELARSDSA